MHAKKWLRCKMGLHNPPKDKWFEEMGAIFVGGPCAYCNDPVLREASFAGNAWDFPGGSTQNPMEDGAPVLLHGSLAGVAKEMRKRGISPL